MEQDATEVNEQKARRDALRERLRAKCEKIIAAVEALPEPKIFLEAERAARADQRRKYLTSAGSPDLWKRNNHAPTPNDRPNDLPEYGLYDGNAKRQRVVGQCALTASCTKDGSDPRSPNYTRK